MKKRWQAVKECQEIFEQGLGKKNISFSIQMKQLYHDREEITVCIMTS